MNNCVSIILPVYNSEKYLRQTIDSIREQTYPDWELLATDDCSKDNSFSILLEYSKIDSRIKVFRLETNSGAGVARNNSILNASGRYIAFIDSDDYWVHDKLESQIHFMKKNSYPFVMGNVKVITQNGTIKGCTSEPSKAGYYRVLFENCVTCQTVMIDTDVVKKPLMSSRRRRQDWLYWLSILKITPYIYCQDKILATYRLTNNSLSRSKIKLVKDNWSVYHKDLGYNWLTSSILFCVFLHLYFLKQITIRISFCKKRFLENI